MTLYDKLEDRLPSSVWRILMAGVVASYDLRDRLAGLRDPLIPPAKLRLQVGKISANAFARSGDGLVQEFKRQGLLHPDSSVLDVGCGCGRCARALSSFLSEKGRYSGFDVDANAISYCQKAYSPRRNFRFIAVDVYSQRYNPSGAVKPDKFQFPFEDGGFDFVLLTSVLTHILPEGLRKHLTELKRVLRPDGSAWVTFYLWNSASRDFADRHPRVFPFPYPYFQHRIKVRNEPEAGICYDEVFIFELLSKVGLLVKQTFYGSWRGGPPGLTAPDVNFQDVVLVARSDRSSQA